MKFQLIAGGLSACITTACSGYLTGIHSSPVYLLLLLRLCVLSSWQCAVCMCWRVHLQSARWVWCACICAGDALMVCMRIYTVQWLCRALEWVCSSCLHTCTGRVWCTSHTHLDMYMWCMLVALQRLSSCLVLGSSILVHMSSCLCWVWFCIILCCHCWNPVPHFQIKGLCC